MALVHCYTLCTKIVEFGLDVVRSSLVGGLTDILKVKPILMKDGITVRDITWMSDSIESEIQAKKFM